MFLQILGETVSAIGYAGRLDGWLVHLELRHLGSQQ